MRLVVKGLLCAVCAFGMIAMTTTSGDAQEKGDKGEKKDGKEGKGGFPGKGGFGQGKGGFPGGPGGGGFPGGMGRGGAIGQIMPIFLREQLKLNDDQKKQMDELQKDVDSKLDKILTEEQRKQLKEIKERGPGGFPGGPGGAGKGGFPPKKDN